MSVFMLGGEVIPAVLFWWILVTLYTTEVFMLPHATLL